MCNKIRLSIDVAESDVASQIRMHQEKFPRETEATDAIGPDALAVSTIYLKLTFRAVKHGCDRVRKSKAYSILTRTTQPAHVAIMFIALIIAASLHSSSNTVKSHNLLCKFVYAASTAAHFGSQIWMTFASGLSLYFSLPRHHFGEVQKILFPLYFTLTSVLSFATLLTHMRLISCTETTVILTACFFVEFFVRLYLCGPLVRIICVKNEMEAKHGLGMEVGTLSRDSDLFKSTEYVAVHKRFRKLHMFIAMSNIACIGFSTAHLYLSVSNSNFML